MPTVSSYPSQTKRLTLNNPQDSISPLVSTLSFSTRNQAGCLEQDDRFYCPELIKRPSYLQTVEHLDEDVLDLTLTG